jgi:hypothetical protein
MDVLRAMTFSRSRKFTLQPQQTTTEMNMILGREGWRTFGSSLLPVSPIVKHLLIYTSLS